MPSLSSSMERHIQKCPLVKHSDIKCRPRFSSTEIFLPSFSRRDLNFGAKIAFRIARQDQQIYIKSLLGQSAMLNYYTECNKCIKYQFMLKLPNITFCFKIASFSLLTKIPLFLLSSWRKSLPQWNSPSIRPRACFPARKNL